MARKSFYVWVVFDAADALQRPIRTIQDKARSIRAIFTSEEAMISCMGNHAGTYCTTWPVRPYEPVGDFVWVVLIETQEEDGYLITIFTNEESAAHFRRCCPGTSCWKYPTNEFPVGVLEVRR